jgi:hypothetical protein
VADHGVTRFVPADPLVRLGFFYGADDWRGLCVELETHRPLYGGGLDELELASWAALPPYECVSFRFSRCVFIAQRQRAAPMRAALSITSLQIRPTGMVIAVVVADGARQLHRSAMTPEPGSGPIAAI